MSDLPVLNGVQAGSKEEVNIFTALQQLKLDFSYQYSIDGGRSVRGGQVIDFIIWVPPRPIAMYPVSYWHQRAKGLEDNLKHDRAEKHGFEVWEMPEDAQVSSEAARRAIKEKVL